MVCSLFPVTFDGGLLHPSNEIADRSLQCIDDGPTLYEGVRSEIEFYFGTALVAELDAMNARAPALKSPPPGAPGPALPKKPERLPPCGSRQGQSKVPAPFVH